MHELVIASTALFQRKFTPPATIVDSDKPGLKALHEDPSVRQTYRNDCKTLHDLITQS